MDSCFNRKTFKIFRFFKMSYYRNKINHGFDLERYRNRDNCFEAIYFLDNLSGSLFLSNKYAGKTKLFSNEDLVCGFLNALNHFIKELKPDSKDDEIQEINFKETRILYERKGRLSVIAVSKKTNLEIERLMLHGIMEDFYYNFENSIRNFNGIIDPSIQNYKRRLQNLNFFDY